MTYKPYANADEAFTSIKDFMASDESKAVSSGVKAKVKSILAKATKPNGSVPYTVADFVEYIYATKQGVPEPLFAIAAQAAKFCSNHGVQAVTGKRGEGMIKAMRRRSGEPGKWPDASDDPETDKNAAKATTKAVEAIPPPETS